MKNKTTNSLHTYSPLESKLQVKDAKDFFEDLKGNAYGDFVCMAPIKGRKDEVMQSIERIKALADDSYVDTDIRVQQNGSRLELHISSFTMLYTKNIEEFSKALKDADLVTVMQIGKKIEVTIVYANVYKPLFKSGESAEEIKNAISEHFNIEQCSVCKIASTFDVND